MSEVSNTPWSDFKESDYTIEQWRRACLISPPQASDSKAEYKLPVKEPSGALNRNGCHSAAAALAGARGGINASTESQKAAAKKLVSLYRNQLEEDPPASLLRLSGESVQMSEEVDEFLAHYGVKGMRWGVRKRSEGGGSSEPTRKERRAQKNREIVTARSRQAARERNFQEAQAEFIVARTNKGQDRAERMMRQMEREYYTHPDAATAQRMTSGEKWATGLTLVGFGLSAASLVARAGRV